MAATIEDILASHRTRRVVLMGVLNVTPDSFSDGGRFLSPPAAADKARGMVAEGADVIDVGAESTRPGSRRVSPAEQIARLEDVLPAVVRTGAVVSIDTTSAQVAATALDAGAAIVNDVSAGRDDPGMFPLAAERGAGICLMHMLGEPKSMQNQPRYRDVVQEVCEFLSARMAAAISAGVRAERIILDPGIGFGKRLEHNLALLAATDRLAALGRAVLIGASRKRFIGELSGEPDASRRAPGTIAACLAAWRGGATIFRVHDVAAVAQAMAIAGAIEAAGTSG